MKNTWVLVSDSSHARIFSVDRETLSLTETDSLIHPEAKLHEQKITSDLPGRQAGGSAGSHHAVSDETDPKKYESLEFARFLARHLEDARNKRDYTNLLIIAAPSFLGQLREQMTAETAKLVSFELDKNLTKHSTDEIRQHLPKRL